MEGGLPKGDQHQEQSWSKKILLATSAAPLVVVGIVIGWKEVGDIVEYPFNPLLLLSLSTSPFRKKGQNRLCGENDIELSFCVFIGVHWMIGHFWKMASRKMNISYCNLCYSYFVAFLCPSGDVRWSYQKIEYGMKPFQYCVYFYIYGQIHQHTNRNN